MFVASSFSLQPLKPPEVAGSLLASSNQAGLQSAEVLPVSHRAFAFLVHPPRGALGEEVQGWGLTESLSTDVSLL